MPDVAAAAPRTPPRVIGFRRASAVVKQNLRAIVAATLLSVLLAVLYLYAVKPGYTASAVLLIEPELSKTMTSETADRAFQADLAQVEKQAALLTSDAVLNATVAKLGLAAGGQSAMRTLATAISVKRRENSFVIDLAAAGSSPENAVRIAAALIDAYLAEVAAAKSGDDQRSNAALEGSLDRLRGAVGNTDGGSQAQVGAPPALHLTNLDQTLVAAGTATADAKARQQLIRLAIKSGAAIDALPPAMRTPAFEKLNEQASALQTRESALSSRLRTRHPRLIETRAQLAEATSKIKAELARMALDAETSVDIAMRRERLLSDQAASARTAAESARSMAAAASRGSIDGSVVNAETLRAVVDAAREAVRSAGARRLDARVINAPASDQKSSRPNAFIVLPMALLAGLGAGLALALASGVTNGAVHSTEDLSSAVVGGFSASTPKITRPGAIASLFSPFETFNWSMRHTPFAGSQFSELASAVAGGQSQSEQAYRQSVLRLLANIKGKQQPGRPHVAMLVSPRSKSGTSAAAASVAYAAALSGERVLLIDANSRYPDLSAVLAASLPPATTVVLDNKQHLQSLVTRDAASGLACLPIALADLCALTTSQSRRLAGGITSLIQDFDLVLIDAGAILEDCSVLCLLPAADQIVMVARAGATRSADVTRAVEALGLGQDRVGGSLVTFAAVEGAL